MKSIMLCTISLLLSVSLTSCWPRQDDSTPAITRSDSTNNILYLHTLVTRGQDATIIFNDMLKVGNVVVDFYANWCNPCKMMSHTIDQVAAQFPSITFLKIDIDQFESIAQQVKSIPTLIFYKDGAQLTRFSGAKDKNSFISLLNKWFK